MSEIDKNFINELVDREKWREILARFIDVLKINVFLVDFEGQVILPPIVDRHGWAFFEQACLGLVAQQDENLLNKFQRDGDYLVYRCESGMQSYAIPVIVEKENTIAYLIVGPVILNKKEEALFYKEIAEELNFNENELMDAINEVRVVSHITMKSILDLLSEVAKDVIELNLEKQKLNQMQINQKDLPKKVSEAAQEIYTTIHLDEILITLLDLALKMTNTECGSIMVVDKENKDEMVIKVSRGLDDEKIKLSRAKIGQGIAGIAAKEKEVFVIHGTKGENRIQNHLKRPEIKHSIVMPLESQNRVFGVINLHTKKEGNLLENDNVSNLQYLSRLISAAFQSI